MTVQQKSTFWCCGIWCYGTSKTTGKEFTRAAQYNPWRKIYMWNPIQPLEKNINKQPSTTPEKEYKCAAQWNHWKRIQTNSPVQPLGKNWTKVFSGTKRIAQKSMKDNIGVINNENVNFKQCSKLTNEWINMIIEDKTHITNRKMNLLHRGLLD